MIKIPEDRPIVEGEIASYWVEDDGILVSLSKSVKRTVENLSANVALVKQITQNKRAPLLIYLTNSPVPDRAAQRFSILFRFQQPPIPMKNFSDEQEARAWLRQYI